MLNLFARSLVLVQQGLITEEEALSNSSSPDDLKLGFRGITKGSTSGEMDMDFGVDVKAKKPKPAADSGDSKVSRGFDF